MTKIGVFSVTSPMGSANYRKGNLLSPPHLSYFALHTHSNTINPRNSTPSATIISQAKPQPSFGRERLSKRKPTSGNLRPAQDDVPTIRKINKALAIIAKSGSIFKYGYTPDVVTVTPLLNGLIAQDTAGGIFKRGYTPDVVTFTTLLSGLIAQDKVDEALSHINKLQLRDIELDLYTFNIAINCYCHLNRVGFGLSLLGSIFKRGYTPNVVTFNTLLNGLIPQDKADEALSLFNKLLLQDIELNLYTFNIAINCYCHMNQVCFGFSLLGSILKRGYMPDGVTFTTLLDGLIAQDKADDALSLFKKLQLQDVEQNLYTFNIAINFYCHVNRVGFGFSLLGSIFNRGYMPNGVTFATLLKGLIAQDKAAEALSLFDKLQLQHIELHLYTFNIAINCYCCVNRVAFGLSLLGSIFKHGYMPDVVTFTTLLNGLLAQDKADEALSLFNKLLLQDIEPTLYTFSVAINCYCHVNRVGFGFSLLGCIFKHYA